MRAFTFWPVLLGLFVFSSVSGQSNYKSFRQNDETIKVGAIADYSGYSSYYTAGAGINIEASGRWGGVNYAGLLGIDSERRLYAYTGIGQVVGFYMFKHNVTDADFFNYLALIGIILPESIFFNVYPSEVSRLSFYVSPWGIEHRGAQLPNQETKVSIEGGVRLALKIQDFYLEPFAGLKAIYGTKRRGFSAGLTFFFESL